MPYIKVSTDKLKTHTTELAAVGRDLDRLRMDYSEARTIYEKTMGMDPRIVQIMDRTMNELSVESYSLGKMVSFFVGAIKTYDLNDSVGFRSIDHGANSPLNKMVKLANDAKNGTGVYSKLAALVSRSNISYDDAGNVIVTGATRSSGLISKYKMSAWASNSKLYGKDKVGSDVNSGKVGTNVNDVWSNANRSTETAIGKLVSGAICAAANVVSSVGAQLASKAAGAVSAACSAIPIVGPALSKVAGSVTNVVVGKAVSTVVNVITSSTTVQAVTKVVETTVGAVKAAANVVSTAAKSVGKAISNIFKGW